MPLASNSRTVLARLALSGIDEIVDPSVSFMRKVRESDVSTCCRIENILSSQVFSVVTLNGPAVGKSVVRADGTSRQTRRLPLDTATDSVMLPPSYP